jgi:hypothetical protein
VKTLQFFHLRVLFEKELWKERREGERKERNLSQMRKLDQLKQVGKPKKDARSDTDQKLGRSRKNCVVFLKNKMSKTISRICGCYLWNRWDYLKVTVHIFTQDHSKAEGNGTASEDQVQELI